jgi:hypothetical protein
MSDMTRGLFAPEIRSTVQSVETEILLFDIVFPLDVSELHEIVV